MTLSVLFLFVNAQAMYAETLTQLYGVNIQDANSYDSGVFNLYALFNDYFQDQLGQNGFESAYSNSNDLFDARGVDPAIYWTTQSSELVGAYKVAACPHTLSLLDHFGNSLATATSFVSNTSSSGQGFIDISDTPIVDAQNLAWQLEVESPGGGELFAWSSAPSQNLDGQIHMIAFDVTDLYNAKYGAGVASAYMFAWEDLALWATGGAMAADWDYQDFVGIITNVTPNTPTVTPEPGTLLILSVGGVAGALAFRRRKK